MSITSRFLDQYITEYAKNSRLFFIWGVVLMALGLVAVVADTFTTLLTVMVLGFFILFSGCVILLDTITFWRGKDHGFVFALLAAVLYIAGGLLLISNPVEGSVTITFLLGAIYSFLGLLRIMFAVMARLPQWGWTLANGAVTLLIGILILMSWPESSLFIIGLFVGIDLFFCGLAYTMAALALRSVAKR